MATGTTVFSRVTVVAPRTRIDVALPADVAVADLLPMLLEMAKETTPDGGVRHGGWCLAKLGGSQLDPSRTLGSLGVVDGDLLQLRKRSDNPPPPLYDDVVDAIAEATPSSYRPWTEETARRIGHVAGGLGLIVAAFALFMAGPAGGGPSVGPAITAGIAAIAAVALGATFARSYDIPTTGIVVAAAGGLPMAFVCGLYVVPGAPGSPGLLLGCALVLVIAAASIWLLGTGVTVFVAAGTAATIGLLAFLVAILLDGATAAGVAAGATAFALACISLLPRLTIQLAKLPLPNVPSNAEDLKDDGGFPDFASIERRAGLAHEYMTGMITGCGVVVAIGDMIAAGSPQIWGAVLAGVATAVLLMRGRSYSNGSQAVALLVTGMLSGAGVLIGWLWRSDAFSRNLWVFAVLIIVGAGSLVLGVVFPSQKFSPVMRRTVDIFEALLIAAVLPLAFAVMDLYSVVRHIKLG
ncbi:MAG: type VII secretion integral membrane protein EccD [Sciscionella sp.]